MNRSEYGPGEKPTEISFFSTLDSLESFVALPHEEKKNEEKKSNATVIKLIFFIQFDIFKLNNKKMYLKSRLCLCFCV